MPRSVFAVGCLLLPLLPLPGGADEKPVTAPEAFTAAESHFAAGELMQALRLYRKVTTLQDDRKRRQAFDRLLEITQRLEMYEQTVSDGYRYRQLLDSPADGAKRAEVSVSIGLACEAMGQYALAEKELLGAQAGLRAPHLQLTRALSLSRLARISERIHPPDATRTRWKDVELSIESVMENRKIKLTPRQQAESVWLLSDCYFYQKRHREAITRLAALVKTLETTKDGQGRVETSRHLGEHLEALGQHAEAARALREALARQEKLPRKEMLVRAGLLESLGDVLAKNKQVAEAETVREQATKAYLSVVKSTASPFSRAEAFWKLQRLYQKTHQYQQGLLLIAGLSGPQAAREAVAGDPRLRSKAGTLHAFMGSYKESKQQFRAALAELEKGDPLNLVELSRVLNSLAIVEQATNNLEQAEKLGQSTLKLYREHRLPVDEIIIETWNLLGTNAALEGEFARGIERFRTGAGLCKKLGGKADRLLSGVLLNQALLFKAQGDLSEAVSLCHEALTVYQRSSEPDSLGVALFECALASLLAEQGKYAAAGKLAAHVLEQCRKYKITSGPVVQTANYCRALGHLQEGQLAEAEKLWNEVRQSQEKAEQNLLLPRTYNYLGLLAELNDKPDLAIKWYTLAASLQEKQSRSIPSTRFVTLWRKAHLLETHGKQVEARATLLQSIELVEQARQKTYGDAQQRTTFLSQFVPAFEQAVTWALRDGKREEAFNLASRVRSRAFLDQLLMAGADPRDTLTGENGKSLKQREKDQLVRITRLRASLALVPADTLDKERSKARVAELDKAQREYQLVWREILNASPLYRGLTDEETLARPLGILRKKVLHPGSALLTFHLQRGKAFAMLVGSATAVPEVFELRVPTELLDELNQPLPTASPLAGDPQRRGLSLVRRKIVGALPRKADLPRGATSVPLNSRLAWQIVEHYRCLLESPGFATTRGLKLVAKDEPGKQAVRGLPAYADVLLPPALRRRIKDLAPEVLLVVPDGVLHKLPLEALLLKSEPRPTFVLDEFPPMIYAPSVSALAFLSNKPALIRKGPQSLLTVSNPAYPLPMKKQPPSGGLSPLLTGTLPRLPFTAEETRRLQRLFPSSAVTALTGEQATEERIRGAIGKHSIIHIAAHGFADERFGNLFGALAVVPPPPAKARPDNDGFLTLVEIYRLPLQQCELAVLSACETNVGPQRPLESGVTLASAFLAAGARRVVASHWSVDDRSTADLVGTFFEEVMSKREKKPSYAAALQKARKKLRDQAETSSPFYWAPFVLLGAESQDAVRRE